MQPLKTVQQLFIWLRVCPAPEPISKIQTMVHTIFAVVVFGSSVCGIVVHSTYMLEYSSIYSKRSVFAFMGVIAYVCSVYIIVTEFFLRFQIKNIFEKLSNIYDACKFFAVINQIFTA